MPNSGDIDHKRSCVDTDTEILNHAKKTHKILKSTEYSQFIRTGTCMTKTILDKAAMHIAKISNNHMTEGKTKGKRKQ